MTKQFKELAKLLKPCNYGEIIELIKEKPERMNSILRAKSYYDLRFFAKFFFSETVKDDDNNNQLSGHTKDPFNTMHTDFLDEYDPDRRNIKKVILASRGSAKTTLLCLIYPLHTMCFGKEQNIMILSSTAPLAIGKSTDIHSEINNNEKLKNVFNLQFSGSNKASKVSFVTESLYGQCCVRSQSFASQIRGYKFGHNRITLFILDDVVHGEEVFSEEQRIKALRQFNTDIWNAKQPGTNFIYIGTRLHTQDLGSTLSKDPTWRSNEYPAFKKWPSNMNLWKEWEDIMRDPTRTDEQNTQLADKFYEDNKEDMLEGADVLWPEREDTLYLMKERLTIGHKPFNAEKQMIAFLTGDCVFEDIQWFKPIEENGRMYYYLPKYEKKIEYDEARFVKYYALDPATGEKKTQTQKKTLSQSARIIACKDIEKGNLYILDAFMDRKPPSKIIYEMYDLHHHHNFHKMGFEENLFRDMYKEHILSVGEKWEDEHGVNLTLPTVSIWNDIDKDERIYGLEPYVTRGKIIINEFINPDFIAQIQTYPNSDHNDALDALQILWQIACKKQGFRSIYL